MNEIKFKIFDKRDKIIRPKNGVLAMIEWNQNETPIKVGVQEYEQIDEEGNGDWCQYLFNEGEFDLIQYTGIKDYNNCEYYNGTIFKRVDTGDTFEVIWSRDCYLARKIYCNWLKKNILYRNEKISLSFMMTFIVEIIGNIHENPELLK